MVDMDIGGVYVVVILVDEGEEVVVSEGDGVELWV